MDNIFFTSLTSIWFVQSALMRYKQEALFTTTIMLPIKIKLYKNQAKTIKIKIRLKIRLKICRDPVFRVIKCLNILESEL